MLGAATWRRNRHQPAYIDLADERPDQCVGVFWRDAGLAGLSAKVYLYQGCDVGARRRQRFGLAAGQGIPQTRRIEAVDQVESRRRDACLVGLQMPDQMPSDVIQVE